MSKAYKSISTGLKEAIDYSKGNTKGARQFVPSQIDVKEVRAKTGMSQREFAASFGISLGTLRHWERGDRLPRGPALVLLYLLEENPKFVLGVLNK